MSKEIEDHRLFNHSGNQPFAEVLARHVSRRDVMRGGLSMAAASMLSFGGTAQALASNGAQKKPLTLAFEAVHGSLTDAVVVPEGYVAQVLVPWGTPLSAGDSWQPDQPMTAERQASSVGMHHDGMAGFALDANNASRRFVLALNNEYIDQAALWAPQGGPTNADERQRPADESRTEINAHGVTMVEIEKDANGHWAHVPGSRYNRRLTSATVMDLAGPVAGSDYVKTQFSPTGMQTRGTNNNCGNGVTPWGTYIACEENWPDIFVNRGERFQDDARIGIPTDKSRYGWDTSAGDVSEQDDEFARFDITPRGENAEDDYRNEARTFGYQVEVDPYSDALAIKRTALGRFRHEGCWLGKLEAGQPVVYYSGHDARNEYVYKYVSDAAWDPADANRPGEAYDRLAIGHKYLDNGTLYVARFHADGSGEWLPLTPDAQTQDGRTLAAALGLADDDAAGIIINTCDAADLLGATPMDRPEWASVDPASGEVYLTLTNNSQRIAEDTQPTYTNSGERLEQVGVGYDLAPTNAANPRANNEAGHIIRWRESRLPNAFTWEVFVFGAAADDTDNHSGLTEMNQFASPDGLWFDERDDGQGILWIQTDNGYEGVTEYTNDQLLAVVPNGLDDIQGAGPVINNSNQQQLKRFAVGPNGCEVTGIFATPDKTALFINIQHPGNWPADGSALTQDATVAASGQVRPRASTVVIQKRDGGPVGV
ncbi:PhoX family phosphatase [Halomonas janggokensis]|jgi:secreted PhoX family phosphatase|uniref:PhoX family phosphatase n=1 Tax=Vreelandella janggokensis TaxID=370767 RepID=A0ABT4IVR6_9GAMM|nr:MULTISPECIES: PhoX family phosphatase [Halomonas]MCZ0927271.1 PhoX family phosphatase [Halomonas janggokensis]MCZ0929779.1 PhoX family phosphatase [Halomonas janggokensis]